MHQNNYTLFLNTKTTLLLALLLMCLSCISKSKNNNGETLTLKNDKQKGAHVFGYLDSIRLQQFTKTNIKWITLVPYGPQRDFDSPKVGSYYRNSQQKTRRDSMWKSQINMAHASGFKVFLKPHIWLTSNTKGKWRSDIFPTSEDNWKQWSSDYSKFILRYAEIAEQTNVELFCIGAELTRLAIEKPDYWKNLIKDIRSIYSGKITYAANWYNAFEVITFWNDLDYIGIQAYFPLAENENPSVDQISEGWNKYIPTMDSIHKKYNRKILSTELGYKSTTDSAMNPWEWIDDPTIRQQKTVSDSTQANCYQAFFKTLWKKEWFRQKRFRLHTSRKTCRTNYCQRL